MSDASARIRSLVARGVVDAGLAAHLSILLDAGVPLTLVSPTGSPTSIFADAFASSLRIDGSRPDADVIEVAGDHGFEWLADPVGIGCLDPRAGTAVRPGGSMLLWIRHLLDGLDPQVARTALRALARGHRAIVEARATDLASLLDALRASPIRLPEDDLQRLGVVLQLDGTRVVAGHLLHPPTGPSRRAPTLLVTWDVAREAWDDFAWAALPFFAERSRLGQQQYDRIHRARSGILEGSADA